MNKIFKVIWNEARNAYVVVSEIAKNHGSKSCSTKKLLAMLIATGVMTCASFDVLAEKPVAATTAAQQGATTGIKINGQDYTIKSGSKVSVTKNAAEKTTTITVDGTETTITDTDTHNELKSASLSGKTLTITGKDNDSVNVDLSSIDTDTKYTAGNGIAINENNGNAISVKLKDGENNLEVTEAGLKLKKALTVNSVAAGDFYMSTAGIGYGGKAYITSSGLNANSQKITGVAEGTISEDSTDAVNGSQLNATNKKVDELNAEAGKHTTLVAGDNVTLVAKKTDNGLEYTVTAKDTTYSAGDNVAIDKDNKISVDLSQYAKTEDVAVVYDQNKTSLRSTNASVAENAIALGKGASAVKDGGVALGNEAHAGNKGTSLGTKAKSGREGATVVGYNTNSSGLYSTVVGTDAVINTDGTAYQTPFKDVIVQGAAATVVGSKNTVDNKNKKVYSGVANNIMGAANTIKASNGVTIQGTGNKVTDAYKDMNITPDEGLAILGGDYSVLAKKQSGAIAVVGGANTVSKQTDSTVIGYDNRLIGGEENISHDVFMAGSHNTLTNVSDSIVMGNENAITGVSNVISFGHQNTISDNNAVAIGNGAGVSVEGGVALGVGSVASTDANALGYGAAEGETGIAWKATNGAVSVGSSVEGKKITRQITNVAAGVADTDAVNVGQLKEAVQAGNTDTHIKPGEYGVGADNKVNMDVVDKNGNKVDTVTIKDVAKASDVGDVSKIADDLKNGGNKPTTVVDAVNNLNNKVGDLQYSKVEKGDIADGDSTTTAIGKLDQKLTDVEATAAKHTKVEGGNNITVTNTAQEGEAANYKVELKKDIDVDTVKATTVTTGQTVMNNDGVKVGKDVSVTATAVTAGKTSISDEGVKVGDKTYISADGLNANDKKVTNVADGKVEKDSKDAINGGQLHQAKADINNRIDGVENQVISNSNRINQLGNRVNKVGAGAAALAALHPMDFDPDDKLTFSAGYGNYGGENAAAIGAYYRPDEKVMFSVGGTVGNGENMVNAGVSFALDRTNHVSNSRTALAREVIDLRGQLAVMGAKMAKMEKALGMLDETKTKLFPDIPANHWAYEYIAKLAGNGYIEGYPDGNFGGDRLMTRYEFAAMLYRAIENGAALEEKIIKEFEPELGRIRVDRISGEDGDRDKIERVRVNDTKGERDHYGNKLAK